MVVEEHVHGLVGALLGAHGGQLVLNRYVIVGREVESHIHVLEGIGDGDGYVEVDETRVLARLGHVGFQAVSGPDAESRIEQIAIECDIAPLGETEILFRHNGHRDAAGLQRGGVAHESGIDGETSRHASCAVHRCQSVGKRAGTLDRDLVLSVGRKIDIYGGAFRNSQIGVENHRHGIHDERIGGRDFGGIGKAYEFHHIVGRARGQSLLCVGHDVGHVRAGQYVETRIDRHVAEIASGCGIDIDECLAIDFSRTPGTARIHDLHSLGLHGEVITYVREMTGIDPSVDSQRFIVKTIDGEIVECHDIAVNRNFFFGESVGSPRHPHLNRCRVEIEESVEHRRRKVARHIHASVKHA